MDTSCCNINSKYSLDFVEDITIDEKKLLLLAFKSFKSPESKHQVHFLSQRDLLIVSEFFARYDEKLRSVDDIGCKKIDGLFCICFIEDCSSADITNLRQFLNILRGITKKQKLSI